MVWIPIFWATMLLGYHRKQKMKLTKYSKYLPTAIFVYYYFDVCIDWLINNVGWGRYILNINIYFHGKYLPNDNKFGLQLSKHGTYIILLKNKQILGIPT